MGFISLSERRSAQLDKKNKGCNISISKRAEFRLAETFGELPIGKDKDKKVDKEEDMKNKMKTYLHMYKKSLTPKTIKTIRALVGINGKAQVDLPSLGFTAVEQSAFSQDVND